MSKNRSLPELGDIIQSHAKLIHKSINEDQSRQHQLSSKEGLLQISSYPDSVQERRIELLDALDELRALVLGPTSYVFYTTVLSVCVLSLECI